MIHSEEEIEEWVFDLKREASNSDAIARSVFHNKTPASHHKQHDAHHDAHHDGSLSLGIASVMRKRTNGI
jgi:hypothetical protein